MGELETPINFAYIYALPSQGRASPSPSLGSLFICVKLFGVCGVLQRNGRLLRRRQQRRAEQVIRTNNQHDNNGQKQG